MRCNKRRISPSPPWTNGLYLYQKTSRYQHGHGCGQPQTLLKPISGYRNDTKTTIPHDILSGTPEFLLGGDFRWIG